MHNRWLASRYKHSHYQHFCTPCLHGLTSSANTNSHSIKMSRFTSVSIFCWLWFCQRICLLLSGLFNPLHCFWHQNIVNGSPRFTCHSLSSWLILFTFTPSHLAIFYFHNYNHSSWRLSLPKRTIKKRASRPPDTSKPPREACQGHLKLSHSW